MKCLSSKIFSKLTAISSLLQYKTRGSGGVALCSDMLRPTCSCYIRSVNEMYANAAPFELPLDRGATAAT